MPHAERLTPESEDRCREIPSPLAGRPNGPHTAFCAIAARLARARWRRQPGRAPAARRRLGDRGASALELALLGPPFMLLVLMIFEIGFQLTVSAALEAGVHQAGRRSIVDAGVSSTTVRATALKTAILAASGGLLEEGRLTVTPVSFDHVASTGAEAKASAGSAALKRNTRYELTYVQPLLTGNLAETALNKAVITHKSTVVVVDEPL